MSRKNIFNENQLSLPFGQVGARAIAYEDRQKVFWTLILGSLLSLAVYVYAINATAHHIAVRQNLERVVAEHRAELATLEFEHISIKNAVTLETARAYGFQEVERPMFVSRDTASSLSFNTARQ